MPAILNNEHTIDEGFERHDFGVTDNKGRAVGTTLRFHVYVFGPYQPGNDGRYGAYSNVEPGTYFSWTPQATRGCEPYGACQNWNLCKTEAERHLAVEKYLKGAKARALKAWSKA